MVNDQEEDVQSMKKDKQKSDVFRLWVRLKIPKDEGPEEGEDGKDRMNKKLSNNVKRVCHVCHKVFNSGKALGGHMRIHVNKKDLVFKKKAKVHHHHAAITFKKHQNPREDSDSDLEEKVIVKPTCAICGKDFRTMKSLFGHMRCHPERDWRGIHPPKNTSSASSLSDVDYPPKSDDDEKMDVSAYDDETNCFVDLTESLKGWSVTARRGRKAAMAAAAEASSSEIISSSDQNDHQLREAVNYLMMLAHGGVSLDSGLAQIETNRLLSKSNKSLMVDHSSPVIKNHSPFKKHVNEQRGSNEVEKAENGLPFHGESVKIESDGYFSADADQMDTENSEQRIIDTDNFEGTNTIKAMMMIKNKKKRKKVKLCELGSTPVTPIYHHHQKVVGMPSKKTPWTPDKYYTCSSCDKSFPTHQALGGHMSSHNRSFNIAMIHNNSIEEKNDNCEGSGVRRRLVEIDLNEVPPSEDGAGFESHHIGLGNLVGLIS